VLEILQEGRWTGRNVERKTEIFVNFDYEIYKNVYTNCFYNLIILTVISQKLLPALHTASPAISRVNLGQLSDI